MPITRRQFFGLGAAASIAPLARPASAAESAQPPPRPAEDFLRIGVVTCHPHHHHMPNIWGPLINCMPPGRGAPTRMTRLLLTHIWDRDPERVRTFCETFGTRPVARYDGMTKDVDGVIISDVRNADVFPELAAPYLQAGVPVLFNRPYTSSLGRGKRVRALSEKSGTPIIVVSGWEYTKEVYAMRYKLRELGPEITAVTATNAGGEISHDVHGVWIILAMLGTGVEAVAMARDEPDIYKGSRDTWTIRYGGRDGRRPFTATLYHRQEPEGAPRDVNAWVRVETAKGAFEQALWRLGDKEARYQYYFLPPLLEFQRMIERGVMPQSHDHIQEKLATYLAGFKSFTERGGKEVRLSELEDDYSVESDPEPLTYPPGFWG